MQPHNPPPAPGETFYARTFMLVTLTILGYLLYFIMLPFLGPLAWALFIAFLVYPIHRWLVEKLGGRANLSATLLVIATIIMLIGPLTALSAAFATQVADLIQYAQRLAADRGPTDIDDLLNIPIVGRALGWVQNNFDITLEQIQAWTVQGLRNVLQFLASLSGKIFVGAIGTVIGFLLTMFLLFFMIRDGHALAAALRALIPISDANKARLVGHLASVTRAMVFGTGVTAIAQGVLIAIGFAIIGLPSPIVFGVFAALLALVPMVGTPVLWAPAVLILVAQQRWGAAIFLLAWGVMVSTMDNFLRPYLVSGRADVGTLTVFIGVLGGVSTFGAIGIFLGPLVLALLIALVRFSLEVRGADTATTPDIVDPK